MIADIPADTPPRIEHVRLVRVEDTSRIYRVGAWIVELREDGVNFVARRFGDELIIIRPHQDWQGALAEHRAIIEGDKR